MPQIRISIQNKIARAVRRDGCIVCGNGDYEILFSFDAEWDPHKEKVARFIWDGGYFDVPFEGDVCPVPCITSAPSVEVGVYAGTLRTTTPAVIRCRPSIRSDVTLEIKPEARKLLAKRGYDPRFGARPLKRVLVNDLETPLSRKLP